jgi:hypothetical protein
VTERGREREREEDRARQTSTQRETARNNETAKHGYGDTYEGAQRFHTLVRPRLAAELGAPTRFLPVRIAIQQALVAELAPRPRLHALAPAGHARARAGAPPCALPRRLSLRFACARVPLQLAVVPRSAALASAGKPRRRCVAALRHSVVRRLAWRTSARTRTHSSDHASSAAS